MNTPIKPKKSNSWKWLIAIGVLGFISYRTYQFMQYTGSDHVQEKTALDNSSTAPLTSSETVAFDLPKMTANNLISLAEHLGPVYKRDTWTDSKAGCKGCMRFAYQSGNVEVIFINDQPDRITFKKLNKYPFNPEFLKELNLPETAPSFQNDTVIRWYDVPGYREVMVFNDGTGHIDYALIKTKAE